MFNILSLSWLKKAPGFMWQSCLNQTPPLTSISIVGSISANREGSLISTSSPSSSASAAISDSSSNAFEVLQSMSNPFLVISYEPSEARSTNNSRLRRLRSLINSRFLMTCFLFADFQNK